jgi:hypothetical protein
MLKVELHLFVPPEMLARIRRIEIRARRLVANRFLGEYHSVFRGRGIEFSEVRQYEPGDDVRAIDWNVTARMGAPYIKKYVEERELTVLLVVDVSASSAFTTTSSRSGAGGRGGGDAAFRRRERRPRRLSPQRPRRGVQHLQDAHVLRIIRELLYLEPAGRGRAPPPRYLAGVRGGARSSSCCRTSSTGTANSPGGGLRHDVVARR